MFLSLCYMVLRWLLQLATLRLRSNDGKALEIVVLRHELAIFRRRTLKGVQIRISASRARAAKTNPIGLSVELGGSRATQEASCRCATC